MVNITFGGGLNELNDTAIPSDEAILGQNFELGLGNTKFKRRAPFEPAIPLAIDLCADSCRHLAGVRAQPRGIASPFSRRRHTTPNKDQPNTQ